MFTWFNQNNSPSSNQNPEKKIWVVPKISYHTYDCQKCDETSEYPEPHRVLCYKDQSVRGCGRHYYTCQVPENTVHNETTCIIPIKVYGAYCSEQGTIFHDEDIVYLFSFKCGDKFRVCDSRKHNHEMLIKFHRRWDNETQKAYTFKKTYHAKKPSRHRNFLFEHEKEKPKRRRSSTRQR